MRERLKIAHILLVGVLSGEAVGEQTALVAQQFQLLPVIFSLFAPLLFDAFSFRNGTHERLRNFPALSFEHGETGAETAVVLADLFGEFPLALQYAVILLFEALDERAHFLCGIQFEHIRLPCRSGASFPSLRNAAGAISRLCRCAAYRDGCIPPRNVHTPN